MSVTTEVITFFKIMLVEDDKALAKVIVLALQDSYKALYPYYSLASRERS